MSFQQASAACWYDRPSDEDRSDIDGRSESVNPSVLTANDSLYELSAVWILCEKWIPLK